MSPRAGQIWQHRRSGALYRVLDSDLISVHNGQEWIKWQGDRWVLYQSTISRKAYAQPESRFVSVMEQTTENYYGQPRDAT